MVKIKKVYVESARSKKFQKYTVGFEAELTADENPDQVVKDLHAKCRILCDRELNVDDALN